MTIQPQLVLNPLAEAANATIKAENATVFELLSERGKRFFFPAKGILAQGAEAKLKAKTANATIGIATENGAPMHLQVVGQYYQVYEFDAGDLPPPKWQTGTPSTHHSPMDESGRATPKAVARARAIARAQASPIALRSESIRISQATIRFEVAMIGDASAGDFCHRRS